MVFPPADQRFAEITHRARRQELLARRGRPRLGPPQLPLLPSLVLLAERRSPLQPSTQIRPDETVLPGVMHETLKAQCEAARRHNCLCRLRPPQKRYRQPQRPSKQPRTLPSAAKSRWPLKVFAADCLITAMSAAQQAAGPSVCVLD